MQQLLQQAMQIKEQMETAQQELDDAEVTGTAGSGKVVATVSGNRDLKSLTIDPSVVDPEDTEMLADLIVAAVRDANAKVANLAQEKLGPLAGGLGGLPGGLGIPGL